MECTDPRTHISWEIIDSLQESFADHLSDEVRSVVAKEGSLIIPGFYYWNDSIHLPVKNEIAFRTIRLRMLRGRRIQGKAIRTIINLRASYLARQKLFFVTCRALWKESEVREHIPLDTIRQVEMTPYDPRARGKKYGTYQTEVRCTSEDQASLLGQVYAELLNQTYQQID